jgi:type IV pilus assembly protein PilP
MQNNRHFRLLFILWAATLLLLACDHQKDLQDLRSYLSERTKSVIKNTKKTEIAELKTPTPVTYNANNLRSPFDTSSSNNKNIMAHPLQAFPLSALRFKGTASQNNETDAFILSPDNKIYQVKIGDIIGDHYGKITKIYPDRIEVEEITVGEAGHPTPHIVTLQLKDAS